MTYTPTLEEFLSEPSADDLDDMVMDEPLVSIADSLRRLVSLSEQHAVDAQPGTGYTVTQEEYDELARAFDDSEAKQQALTELIADIEAIIKPSTSKLANSVRTTIAGWLNPEVPAEEPEEKILDETPQQPAHDADVEEWARYAESLGHEVPDHMNRSQIRTLLGIDHGGEQS